ncbi:hypothetical protein BZG77_11005 [Salinivibrio sp. IB643]|nr:hypothetical protein BZG77_11005 [Salinivibrio sp. IB643]
MGRSRYKITEPHLPHFVTLTVLHWIPVFTRPVTVNILLRAMLNKFWINWRFIKKPTKVTALISFGRSVGTRENTSEKTAY